VRYEIRPDLIARAAVSRTMARPLFDDLAPQRQVNIENLRVSDGNPDLEPYLSSNADFSLEKYLPALGLLYGGVFYKHVDSFVFTRANVVTSGEYAGYTLTRPENGEGAEVFGAEFQWQQQLSALPGLLGGLGVGANYTYVDSKTHISDRPGEVFPLVGQSRHTTNLIGSFQRWGATARVAYNYRSHYLNTVQGLADNDEYTDDYGQWDSQFEYAIRRPLRLFVDVVNLGDAQLRAYSGDRSRVRMVELTGRRVQFGTRVDF
jgi:TonB-dependent receptor